MGQIQKTLYKTISVIAQDVHNGAIKEPTMQINPTNLQRAREAMGLSLEGLARFAKVNRQTIHRIETQPKKGRHPRVVKNLADKLGLSVSELCGPDMDFEAKKRAEPRPDEKSQLNVRVSDRIRNSFSLLALRYGVTPSQVVQIAPFLFMWAAELSLQQRRDRMREFRDAETKMRNALPSYLEDAPRIDDELLILEERSIRRRDIFGMELEGATHEFLDRDYGWRVPLTDALTSLTPQMPDDVAFETWWLDFEPHYEICRSDAIEWLDGDTEAAEHILAGRIPFRDIPADLLKGSGSARAAWIREEGDRRKAASDALFDELDREIKEALAAAEDEGAGA